MAAVGIMDLDDGVRERLRVRAAQHGCSMEEDILAIPTDMVHEPSNFARLAKALPARSESWAGLILICRIAARHPAL